MMSDSEFHQQYRDCVVKEYNKILMTGLPEREANLHDIPLDKVFITLNITLESSRFERLDREELAERGQEQWREARRTEIVTLSLSEALQKHRCLIMRGAPGSGKTTLLRWLAVTFATQRQADADRLGVQFEQVRFPVLIELRRFGVHLQKLAELPTAFDLAEEIAKYLSQDARFGQERAWVEQQLQQPCVMLLDGLDEVADAAARQRLLEAVTVLTSNPLYQNLICILTTRPHGFQGLQLSGFVQTEVKPFDAQDVTQFIQQWYQSAYGDTPESQQEAQELLAQVAGKDRVAELATNPLLCTIIAVIYRNNRVLPNRRVELYLKCCEAMLDTWERNKQIKDSGLIGGFDWQVKLELLMPIAYWFHGETERLAVPEAEVVQQLVKALQPLRPDKDEQLLKQEAREFITVIRDRSGLLQGRGDGTLEFSHRTFQEYLAARHIASLPELECIDAVMDHLHEAWWREVHLLVIGHLGGGRDQAAKAEKLMLTILNVYKPPFSFLLPAPDLGWKLGVRLPRLQWRQRIAWHLMREFELVTQGYADCSNFGRTSALTNALTAFVSPRITKWAHHYFYQRLLNHLLPMLPKTLSSHDLAVNELIKALQDESNSVRINAAWSLGQLGQGNDKVIDALLSALQDKSEWVREKAAKSLGQLGQGNDKVIDALLSALHDRSWQVRCNAATSLGQLGQGNDKVIDALLLALQDGDEDVRHNAAESLGQLGQGNDKVINALLSALQVENMQRMMTESLGQLVHGNDKVIDALLSALQDTSKYARNNAATSLGQGNDKVINALLSTLQDKNERVRREAARSLGQLGQGNDKVINALLSALQDKDEWVRRNAAESLGKLGQGNNKVIDALLSALQDKDSSSVRSNAAESLGQLGQGNDKVIDALLSALQDKEKWVRQNVAMSLTQLEHSSEAVIDALLEGMGWGDSEETAESLAKQLKLSGGKYENKVLITLNQYLHDSEQYLHDSGWYLHGSGKRNKAFEVLRKLMDGKPLPGYRWRSLARRQQWWNALKSGLFSKTTLGIVAVLGLVILTIVSGYQTNNESFTNALNVILTFLTYLLPFI